ncbi:hypothetical protein D0T50_05655 [Bacteroides sp. 214]|uniref:DUF6804 family protein n=1 Tax=Bacteroides sp. 214 TaxID=2302935 RepID=UPI0013D1B30E|nr:DUF6804 family protein [Bacteroides sp. 214]NDW12374.1 hypothetical protein [Bacteroides sp. 214]
MKLLAIFLSALLLLCLLDMPYGYYILVRYIATIVFGILAYRNHGKSPEWLTIVWVALAVLFQPFIKLPLGRELWNVVDVVTAVVLLVFAFRGKFEIKNK